MSKKRFSLEQSSNGKMVVHCILKCTGRGHLSDLWMFNDRWRDKLISEFRRFLDLYLGISVVGMQCMSSHFHLVLILDRNAKRTRDEMAAAYNRCYPNASMDPNSHACRKLQEEQSDLGKFLGRFERDFAIRFNLSCKFKRTGHLWGEPYHCTQITDSEGLLRCWTYVMMNTVNAEMTDNPLKDGYNSLTYHHDRDPKWLEEIMDNFYQLWCEFNPGCKMTLDEFKNMITKMLAEVVKSYLDKDSDQREAWKSTQKFWERAVVVGTRTKMTDLADKIPWRLHEEAAGKLLWS